MRTSLQNPLATWQGLGLTTTDDPSDDINRDRPGEVADALARLGGQAPVTVLLRLLSDCGYTGGPEQLLLDALCDAPGDFRWYRV